MHETYPTCATKKASNISLSKSPDSSKHRYHLQPAAQGPQLIAGPTKALLQICTAADSHLCSKERQLCRLLVCQLSDRDGVGHNARVAGQHTINVLPHLQQEFKWQGLSVTQVLT
jgi:hypothetical protein